MKLFIRNICIFFLIFVGIYFLSMLVIPPQDMFTADSTNAKLAEVADYKDVDLLFLGASRGYRGFDPRIFAKYGYRSFNLASSMQTPLQSYVLLMQHIKTLNPKLVVFEISPPILENDGVESALDLLTNGSFDFQCSKEFLKTRNFSVYRFLAYSLIRDGLGIGIRNISPELFNNDTYISGGFIEKKTIDSILTECEPYEWKAREYQLEAFSKCLDLLKQNNIEYILVSAPVAHKSYESCTNMAEFRSMMEQYGRYYDFFNMLNLNDKECFYDNNHLNQHGVEIFDEALVRVLIDELGFVPEGR